MGSHPDSDELRVLAGQKNNLSLPPRGLAYRIESAENGTARIIYRAFSEATAAQLLRVPEGEEEKSTLAEAKEFLTSELARTPVSAKAIKKSTREAEISERTLKRAKQVLGVKSEKESDGSWTWSLPDKDGVGAKAPLMAMLALLARMPTASRTIPYTYGKKAKGARRPRGPRCPSWQRTKVHTRPARWRGVLPVRPTAPVSAQAGRSGMSRARGLTVTVARRNGRSRPKKRVRHGLWKGVST